jgi:hypothetical protein
MRLLACFLTSISKRSETTMPSITKRTVDAAKPASRDSFLWDDEIAGFGLKVTPAGGKVYIYQYRMTRPGMAKACPTKRYTIGRHGNLTPTEARTRAKELAALVSQGIDPRQMEVDKAASDDEAKRHAAEKARVENLLAFDRLAAVWLDHYENEKERRPASVAMARLVVNRYLLPVLASKPMPHITRADMQPILDSIPTAKRGMRRAVFAYASILFGWAHKRGDIADNPLTSMAKPEAPKARDRVLSDDELASIWTGTADLSQPFGPFFRLLILTGQRRSEVAGIGWAELDRATAYGPSRPAAQRTVLPTLCPYRQPPWRNWTPRIGPANQSRSRKAGCHQMARCGTGAHHHGIQPYQRHHQGQNGFG